MTYGENDMQECSSTHKGDTISKKNTGIRFSKWTSQGYDDGATKD